MPYSHDMRVEMPLARSEPPHDCPRCSRLVELRKDLRRAHPEWWNAPVPSWGDPQAWLAIVGLAPGLKGANRTGRPFTGDDAGRFLVATLAEAGLSRGRHDDRPDDGLALNGTLIHNAVRCVPPGNKPQASEVANCRAFLAEQLDLLANLRAIVALGRIAHETVLRVFGLRLAGHSFAHGAEHDLPSSRRLLDSYHCSRQNTNTGKLTREMFATVFERAKELRT